MAAVLDQVTVGEKVILVVDADPGAAAGTPAEIGSLAMLESGGAGTLWQKIGAADTAWDMFTTATSGTNVKLGNYRRLAIYDTDANGYSVDDQIQQNSQDIDVIIAAQASRTVPLTYVLNNPGDAISTVDFIVSEGAQTKNGNMTFTNDVIINGDLDVNGTLTSIDTVNTTIKDKLVTLNKGGAASSGNDSGIEIEENSVITGYIKVNSARDGYLIQAPGVTGDSNFVGTTANQTYNMPDEDGRMVLQASTAAGVVGQLPYWSTDEKLANPTGTGADSLTWDSVNSRLGVGTATPTQQFHVVGTSLLAGDINHITADDDVRECQGSVSTTDATLTTLKSLSIPTDSVVMIQAEIKGRKTGGAGSGAIGDGAAYVRTIAVKNVGGTVTVIKSQSDFTAEDINAFNCKFIVSGTSVNIQVQGSANNNVDWRGTLRKHTL